MPKILSYALAALLTLTLAAPLQAARLSSAQTEGMTTSEEDQMVTIDFRDVDIKVVAKFISELTGKNFIFDRQIQGRVTVYSPTKVTVKEAYQLFLSVLEINGFTTVDAGKFVKVVPSLKAKTKAIGTQEGTRAGDKTRDEMITQIVRLKYASAAEVRKLLTPLLDRAGVMINYDDGNLLIITDYASNVARLGEIIETVDVEEQGRLMKVIPLKHASAREMAKNLTELLTDNSRRNRNVADDDLKVVADERTNSLIVLHGPGQLATLMDMLEKLDTPAPRGADKVHVYFLENAEATELASVLNSLATGAAANQAQPGKGQANVLLQEAVTIVADKANNALVIRAESQDYQLLSSIIEKLDAPRAQVLVEGLIMETSLQKALSLGTEWRNMSMPNSGSGTTVFGGTNLSSGGSAINNLIANPLTGLPTGFAIGLAKGVFSNGTNVYPNIGLLVQALQSDTDVNILSTPSLLTMDNQEASIVVGEERPFLKSSTTQSSTTAVPTVTNTYEFKDLGITLKLTPSISQGKFVKLDMFLQVKNFLAEAETGAISSTKREATTSVMVTDGETIVIGGMLREDTRNVKNEVPCLGQIPLFGWLFKTKNDSGDKTNLLIMITPTIIRGPETLREVSERKRKEADEFVEEMQEDKKNRYKETLKKVVE